MKAIIIISQYLTFLIIRPLMHIFAGLKVEGKQFLETINGPVIFIANHRNMADPFLAGTAMPFKWFLRVTPYRFMTKVRFVKNPYIKLIMKMWGTFTVAAGTGSLEQVLRPTREILNDPQQSLFIFPEGGVITPDKKSIAKPGVAYLARESKRLIVPIAIIGTAEMSWLKFFTWQNKLIIRFGQPFYYHEVAEKDDDLRLAAENIFARVNKMLPEGY